LNNELGKLEQERIVITDVVMDTSESNVLVLLEAKRVSNGWYGPVETFGDFGNSLAQGLPMAQGFQQLASQLQAQLQVLIIQLHLLWSMDLLILFKVQLIHQFHLHHKSQPLWFKQVDHQFPLVRDWL
jgi:hypothetical protein